MRDTAENPLSQNDIASMRLTAVTVSFTPDAGLQWEDGIRAYAMAKAISDDQISTATDTPEGKAYVRSMLAPVIQTGISKVWPANSLARGRYGSMWWSSTLRFHRRCNAS